MGCNKKERFGAEAMRKKVLLFTAFILASLIVIVSEPVCAPLDPEDYDITKYDPEQDAMRARSGGAFIFMKSSMPGYSISRNIEITKITSSYVVAALDKIELTMQVAGSIVGNDDNYKYAFGIVADGKEYIVGYSNGLAVGFELESSDTFTPVASTSGNTLTLTFLAGEINAQNSFDVSGAAVYTREEEYERFLDLAPDKLLLITEPSDLSTVNGQITVEGVVRDSVDNKPTGNVRLQIDDGGWQSVSGSGNTWSYSLDTTTLTDDTHTIKVEMEGETLDNAKDQIDIKVHQNTGDTTVYNSFNEKPEPVVGSYYRYESLGYPQIIGIPIDISNEMTTRIEAYETISPGGKEYDTFRMYTETHGEQNLGYVSYTNDVKRWTWKEDVNFGTAQERTQTKGHVIGNPEKVVDSTTTYDPPFETHNYFDVKVGFNLGSTDNRWTFNTDSSTKSNTTVSGETTSNPDLNEDVDITGECLYYIESMNVFGNTFDDIFVISIYYENPGVRIVEYYSVELGVPVQIDTYDPSRNLLFSLGLEDHSDIITSLIIDSVSFDPAKPMADSDNKIIVQLNNIGSNAATNFKITVMDGDKQVAQEDVPTIDPDSTSNMEIPWKPTAPGMHNLTITLSYDNTNTYTYPVSVDVEKAGSDNGGIDMMLIIPIIVIVIVVVVVLVIMMKRKGAGEAAPKEAEPPSEAAQTQAAAAPVTVASEPEPQATPAATAPQMLSETIQCPSCKQGFSVEYESKPVRVKCPNCGTEGVLK
jgi:hypothetical protein